MLPLMLPVIMAYHHCHLGDYLHGDLLDSEWDIMRYIGQLPRNVRVQWEYYGYGLIPWNFKGPPFFPGPSFPFFLPS